MGLLSSSNGKKRDQALHILADLSQHGSNVQRAVISASGIAPLIACIEGGATSRVRTLAAEVIANLAQEPPSRS